MPGVCVPGIPRAILVTGGCGFLGHHLVAKLLADGHQVTVLDDLSTGTRENLPDSNRVHLVEGSILDPRACARAADGIEVVFHLAAVVGMRLAVADRDRAYQIAEAGTRNVLAATGDAPAVLFSSSAVYGLTSQVAVAEADTVGEEDCLNYDGGYKGYASGKWALEQLGQAEVARGRQILIVRPFNAVGEGQTGTYGMVVPSFVKAALSDRPLTIYDDGSQSRTFSEVKTFSDCLLRLAARDDVWAPPLNVINIGTQESTTIQQLAGIVREETSSSSPLEYIPYTEIFPGKVDVHARVPDTTRLESLVGTVQWPLMREIVRDLVQLSLTSVVN